MLSRPRLSSGLRMTRLGTMLRDAEREHLLSMARSSIAAHLAGEVRAPAPLSIGTKAGAFVTLHRGSELRGCIGHVEADQLLEMVVPRMAVAACSGDPRSPVSAGGNYPNSRSNLRPEHSDRSRARRTSTSLVTGSSSSTAGIADSCAAGRGEQLDGGGLPRGRAARRASTRRVAADHPSLALRSRSLR
jgi:hypothetical protein